MSPLRLTREQALGLLRYCEVEVPRGLAAWFEVRREPPEIAVGLALVPDAVPAAPCSEAGSVAAPGGESRSASARIQPPAGPVETDPNRQAGEPGVSTQERGAAAGALAHVDPVAGMVGADANRLAGDAGVPPKERGAAAGLLLDLWHVVLACDLLEVRVGWGQRAPGGVPADAGSGPRPEAALEAVVTLDESAAFRHPEWEMFGVATDPAGGPYLGRADGIDAGNRGEALSEADLAALPAMDALIVRAYGQARGAG